MTLDTYLREIFLYFRHSFFFPVAVIIFFESMICFLMYFISYEPEKWKIYFTLLAFATIALALLVFLWKTWFA